MHPGYEMARIQLQQQQRQQQQQQLRFMGDDKYQSQVSSVMNHQNSNLFGVSANLIAYQQQQQHSVFQQVHEAAVPITHQLFQQQQQHFQGLLQGQYGYQGENNGDNVGGGKLNFRLGLNEKSTGSYGDAVFGEGEGTGTGSTAGLVRGSEQQCVVGVAPETSCRHSAISLAMPNCWQDQEDSAIKQTLWKQNRNNQASSESGDKDGEDKMDENTDLNHENVDKQDKYRFYGELEAICRRPTDVANGTNNQTGSGSAFRVENMPVSLNCPSHHQLGAGGAEMAEPVGLVGQGSETSLGEEEEEEDCLRNTVQKRRNKKKKKDAYLGPMAQFFESLVKQLMEHQEGLHRKFMEVVERQDEERREREEVWRRQEMAKSEQEAKARAQERVLASSREAAIVSYLEKVTGQTINLPSTEHFVDTSAEEPNSSCSKMRKNQRWPKAEVEALIQVRTGLEAKFQEQPGTKGPLWEEISSALASMGFHKSAKKCKEKWENINKYLKKTKEDHGKIQHQPSSNNVSNSLSCSPAQCSDHSMAPSDAASQGKDDQETA